MSTMDRYGDSLLGVFGTPQRVLREGKGAIVWDIEGREYLDLLGGIAVNALGHGHPAVVAAVHDQWNLIAHTSNLFATEPQIRLAERLLGLLGTPEGARVFLANSGTEANEAAFKLARVHGGPERDEIIAFEGGFHGRTMGALALTAKEAYRAPFEPVPAGVRHLPYGDLAALDAAIGPRTAAVVMEPVQGESGVIAPPEGFMAAARRLTREHGALLILDEVQTGIGRTGSWFAFQQQDLDGLPDAITLAKGLGGGYPIGAMVTLNAEASALLTPGMHGTTFGGNPAASAAALATLEVIESEGLLAQIVERSEQLSTGLQAADERVTEVRAHGLLIGIELSVPIAAGVVAAGLEHGFILNAPRPTTLRLAPPLILSADQAAQFIDALPGLLDRAEQGATP